LKQLLMRVLVFRDGIDADRLIALLTQDGHEVEVQATWNPLLTAPPPALVVFGSDSLMANQAAIAQWWTTLPWRHQPLLLCIGFPDPEQLTVESVLWVGLECLNPHYNEAEVRFRLQQNQHLRRVCQQLRQVSSAQAVAMEAFEASETKFFTFFHLNPLAIAITTADDGRFVEVNPALEAASGYCRENILGQTPADLELWPDEQRRTQVLAQLKSRQTALCNQELDFRVSTGEIRKFLVSLQQVVLSGVTYIIWVGNDITNRVVAQEALRRSEERWQLALQGNNDGIWDLDCRTRKTVRSQRWHQLLGYDPSDLPADNRAWIDLIHPDDQLRVLAADQAYLDREIPHFCQEYRLRCKDGSYRWFLGRAQAVWDTQGQPLRMVGSIADITDRKHQENALRLIVEGTAAATGDNFIRACVRYLAEALGVRYAFIAELTPFGTAHTLALWAGDRWQTIVDYPVAGTPSEVVYETGWCYCPDQVQQAFPQDKNLADYGMVGYVGVALRDVQGQLLGHLAAMDTKPLPLTAGQKMILQIFAARAGAELERLHGDRQRQYQSQVEQLLAKISRMMIDQPLETGVDFALMTAGECLGASLCFALTCSRSADHPAQATWQVIQQWRAADLSPALGQPLQVGQPHQLPFQLETQLLAGIAVAVDSFETLPPRWTEVRSHLEQQHISALLILPMTYQGQVVGAVGAYCYDQPHQWRPPDQQLLRVIGELIAISQARHSAEAALQQSEAQYRYLVETANCIILRWGVDGTIHFMNDYGQRFFGYPAGELIGQSVLGTIVPLERADLVNQVRHQPQRHLTNENENLCRDGRRVWLAWSNCPIPDSDGNLGEILSVGTDISERKQAELALARNNAALEAAIQSAEAANRVKGEFLANMSHELRTPLNAILGFTQLMGRDRTLSDDHQASLRIINNSGEHLLRLINEVLDMSKIEAGRAQVNPKSFHLLGLVNALRDLFEKQASRKGLHLEIDVAPNLPPYLINDESKLRQILTNLLGNGIKFTQTGTIQLRLSRLSAATSNQQSDPAPDPETAQQPGGDRLLIEVIDTGSGIPADHLDHIFQAFIQSDSGRQTGEGTGLGLAISQRYVNLLGGQLAVESQLGQGTRFYFSLPLVPAATGSSPSPQQQPPRVVGLLPNQPAYRVLVVEDRWESRQLLVRLLRLVGFEVKEACNGLESLEIWQAWQPHLIWMDMRMPVMDGYEATREIKAHLKGQATVVIALTASALEEEKAVVLSAGCDDFVRKPFQETVIMEKMAQHLGVKYVYEQSPENVKNFKAPFECPEDPTTPWQNRLSQLPADWLKHLHQAATLADESWMIELLEQIPPGYSSERCHLHKLLSEFCYDQLMQLATTALTTKAPPPPNQLKAGPDDPIEK
jgi:two-component system sensor histidine kinase/response regulator